MQTDNNQLYKITAEKTGKSETIYKDIGNFVFKSLATHMKKPKSLIIKLKGVGTWYLRKQRMEITLKEFNGVGSQNPDYEAQQELRNLFKERLKDYDEFIKEKKFVRHERNKTQVLLQPDRRED